ncbi:MAG: hypothetical protein WCF96_05455 [Eubacteriales bacterium]
MNNRKKIIAIWVMMIFIVTFNCILVYIVAQQTLRLGANELPAQFAIEASTELQNGKSIDLIIPKEKMDVSKGLNTFVMIFDRNKNIVESSGILDNVKPSYPKGVLEYVDKNNESRVTWQPQDGLRFASVAIKYENGYVVAAKSLSETEKLIDKLGGLIFLAWLACIMFITIALSIIYVFIRKIKKKTKI